jgi:hypothetical protein
MVRRKEGDPAPESADGKREPNTVISNRISGVDTYLAYGIGEVVAFGEGQSGVVTALIVSADKEPHYQVSYEGRDGMRSHPFAETELHPAS